MSSPNETDDDSDAQQTPARRSVLRSIGAAGATVSAGAAATGSATASDGVDQFARANATEARARRAFDSQPGRELLQELSSHGYLESAAFDSLNVSGVTAARTFSLDRITATQGHYEDGAMVGFITGLENDEFDGPIIVRLFPEAGIAGATAERDGEPVVLSSGYGGFRSQSSVQAAGCSGCTIWDPQCVPDSHDCDCDKSCDDPDVDMNSARTAHVICDDGRPECHGCTLCCDSDCGW